MFFQIINFWPIIPTTIEIFKCPVFLTITDWPDFLCLSGSRTFGRKFQRPQNFSNVPLGFFFGLLLFGRIFKVFLDYCRLTGNSNYHRFFQMSLFLTISVWPDFQRFSGLLTLDQKFQLPWIFSNVKVCPDN